VRWLVPALLGVAALGQQLAPTTDESTPTIVYTFENPDREVKRYSIFVDDSGRGRYLQTDDAKELEFTVSEQTRERIFLLAKSLRFFDGDFNFTKHRVAYTGDRTLSYQGSGRQHTTRYRHSSNPAVAELTGIFEGIQHSLAADDRLRFLLRHDKLGLNGYLAALERDAKNGWLKEKRLLASTLKSIESDRSVMEIARQRAQRLLQGIRE